MIGCEYVSSVSDIQSKCRLIKEGGKNKRCERKKKGIAVSGVEVSIEPSVSNGGNSIT